MVVQVFCLLDSKTGIYSQPWFFVHEAMAIRTVCELSRDKATAVGRYPEDFVLLGIGEYDDGRGVLTSHQQVVFGSVAAVSARLLKEIQ